MCFREFLEKGYAPRRSFRDDGGGRSGDEKREEVR